MACKHGRVVAAVLSRAQLWNLESFPAAMSFAKYLECVELQHVAERAECFYLSIRLPIYIIYSYISRGEIKVDSVSISQ